MHRCSVEWADRSSVRMSMSGTITQQKGEMRDAISYLRDLSHMGCLKEFLQISRMCVCKRVVGCLVRPMYVWREFTLTRQYMM